MYRLFLGAASACAGQPSAAQVQEMECNFTTDRAQYGARVTTTNSVTRPGRTNIDPLWPMSGTRSETTAYSVPGDETNTTTLLSEAPDKAHVMLPGADGIAKYAVIPFDGSGMITYHGMCGAFE